MANLLAWTADAFNLGAAGEYVAKANSTIDASVKHEGTGSMKVTSTAGVQADQGYKRDDGANVITMSMGGSYYHRFWMKIDSALVWSNQNKFKACRWKSTTLGVVDFMTGYLLDGGVQPGEHSITAGFTSDQGSGTGGEGPLIAYNFNPTTNTAVQNFQEYIILFKLHSADNVADGQMSLYVNGTLIGSLTHVCWWAGAGGTISEIWAAFMMFNFPQDVNGSIWIDDVSVDTTFNSNFSGSAPTASIGWIHP